jgi:hypothetical protein
MKQISSYISFALNQNSLLTLNQLSHTLMVDLYSGSSKIRLPLVQFCLLFPNYPVRSVFSNQFSPLKLNTFPQSSVLNQDQLLQKILLLTQSSNSLVIKPEESSFWMNFSKSINNRLYKSAYQSKLLPNHSLTFICLT